MMRHPTHTQLKSLVAKQSPPCVSIYMPTTKKGLNHTQDAVKFRTLVRGIERKIGEKYADRDAKDLLERLTSLADDKKFWERPLDGLAILGSLDRFEIFRLARTVTESVTIADSFHVTPLLRVTQSADHFHVLSITTRQARFFEGNRYGLTPIERDGMPATLAELVGTADEKRPDVGPYSQTVGGKNIAHSHGSGRDESSPDAENFFRAVDREVTRHFSQPTGLPLILVGLPEHQTLFRKHSKNPQLWHHGVTTHPESMSLEDIRRESWAVIEPQLKLRLGRIKEEFTGALAHGKGAQDLAEASRAAAIGRIAMLLVEAERQIVGHMDAASGAVEYTAGTTDDDLLDDLAESVIRTDGQVIVCPREDMPTTTGLAAIYRY